MPSIDPWPLTPVLAQLPAVARLNRDFEAERLRSDLDATDGRWADIKIMTGAGVGAPITDNDWRSIPLRSIGGDLGRTDPGGPDLIGFADTPLLDRMPNLQAVLSAIPGEIRSVRLMALGPGVSSPLHSDTKLGLPWGLVRLHVPIVTDPNATLLIDDTHHHWPAGQLWYADFTRLHAVENRGTTRRIHLVFSVGVSDELLELFPEVFRRPEHRGEFLDDRPAVALGDDVKGLPRSFQLPTAFLSYETFDDALLTSTEMVDASVEVVADQFVLLVDGQPRFGLVHVGGHEFRLAGWTMERSIQIPQREPHVILRTRQASHVHVREVGATTHIPVSHRADRQ